MLSLTKGLERYKVLTAKTLALLLFWTVGYWFCFLVTYGVNMIFWDNSGAAHLLLSALCWWLFGLWVLTLMVLFSTVFSSNIGVLGCVAGTVLLSYLPSFLPKVDQYLPTFLLNGSALNYGLTQPKDYGWALAVTGILSLVCLFASIPLFNKKQL